MVAYRGADMFSPDRAALELIDEACSDLGSRFFVRIREKMGLAYFVGIQPDAGAGARAVCFLPWHLAAKAGGGPGRTAGRDRAAREPTASRERNWRAQRRKPSASRKSATRARKRWPAPAHWMNSTGSGTIIIKPRRALLEAVTLEQARQVAQKYFLDKPRVIAIVSPEAPQRFRCPARCSN